MSSLPMRLPSSREKTAIIIIVIITEDATAATTDCRSAGCRWRHAGLVAGAAGVSVLIL